ncbi:hypothetical protein DAEQUDRAFT_734978 [Daedalea quercina L-15889]|uniref:Uncharacterized protein n=1 Tax=Daedalea quercina L-15889 TaxID=1314783 RepID=A0A165TYN4_9APHY|nr:hypothetical protein DAEQUDRAFT_734978 [Daedalea quercina L-15889]
MIVGFTSGNPCPATDQWRLSVIIAFQVCRYEATLGQIHKQIVLQSDPTVTNLSLERAALDSYGALVQGPKKSQFHEVDPKEAQVHQDEKNYDTAKDVQAVKNARDALIPARDAEDRDYDSEPSAKRTKSKDRA